MMRKGEIKAKRWLDGEIFFFLFPILFLVGCKEAM